MPFLKKGTGFLCPNYAFYAACSILMEDLPDVCRFEEDDI